ncbi:MAG: hypothetical protein JXR03_12250 [Cyclobacteriaceae bacterium]
MKLRILSLVGLLLVSLYVHPQIVGEVHDASIILKTEIPTISLSSNDCDISWSQDYCSGYLLGIQKGQQFGPLDATNCLLNQTDANLHAPRPTTQNPVSAEELAGFFAGWVEAYTEAFSSKIDELEDACSSDEYFDLNSCSCLSFPDPILGCTGTNFLWDGDGDGYFHPDKQAGDFDVQDSNGNCAPGTKWKRIETLKGVDCNDSDASKNIQLVIRRDEDRDGYTTGDAVIQCLSDPIQPGWILAKDSKGTDDCDDDPSGYKIDWYYADGDGDDYGDDTNGDGALNDADRFLLCGGVSQLLNAVLVSENKGLDLCPYDPYSNEPVLQYPDEDRDEYHLAGSTTTLSCSKPGDRRVREDRTKGEDCADDDRDINEKLWLFQDLDGDGYTVGTATFRCPEEGYIPTSEGEDCNDDPANDGALVHSLNDCQECKATPSIVTYYYDGDGDDYHSAVFDLCPSDFEALTEAEKAKHKTSTQGEDCDDSHRYRAEIITWYLDVDGDGYYVDKKDSCHPPGGNWSPYSNSGLDLDDHDVWVTGGASCSIDFIIPSLIKDIIDSETGEAGNYVEYLGQIYSRDELQIAYRGRNFLLSEIDFDRWSGDLTFTKRLLVKDLNAIIGAHLEGVPVALPSVQSGSSIVSQSLTDPDKSQWMIDRIAESSIVNRSVTRYSQQLDDHNRANYRHFNDDFDETKVDAVLTRVQGQLNRAGLTVQVKVYEEVEVPETGLRVESLKTNTLVGPGSTPDVDINLRKTADGALEFVVIFDKDKFTPSQTALQNKGWEDGQALQEQMETIHEVYMPSNFNALAFREPDFDFVNPTAPSSEPGGFSFQQEEYPGDEVAELSWIESVIEYTSFSAEILTNLETPASSYDYVNSETEYNDRSVHSIGSLSGVIDESMVEIKDLAELFKLSTSMFQKSFWNQILESISKFNLADFAQSQVNQAGEFFDKLQGDHGKPVQYHTSASLGVKTIRTILAGWKTLLKVREMFGKSCVPGSKINPLDRMDNTMAEALPDKLLKSESFSSLDFDTQQKLLDDIAKHQVDGVASNDFAKFFDGKPELVDAWKVLDDAGIDDAIRKNPIRLSEVDNYLKKNPGTEDAIKQGISDVGEYQDEFMNGIKNATEDLSHLNGRSALPDEIADAVTRIKQHRIDVNKPSSGNLGHLDGNINGSAVDNKMWSSGPADPNIEPQIFDATEVGGWVRNTDSEFKMLNKLADDLGGVKGQTYPHVNGTLKIVSERAYCASCQGVIQQFNEMFPNIELILVDGVR